MSTALAAARTFLFVPADDARKRAKAWTAGADAVILDLEDAVAPSAKASARAQLGDALAARPEAGPLVVIRVNGLDTPDGSRDLDALHDLSAAAVLVPKANVATLAIAELARPVIALIETATAVLRAEEIARAPGVERLMFGPFDLVGELGCDPGSTGDELLLARSQVVLASAAAGLASPIDGPSLVISECESLSAETDRARRLGFTAKACIHPAQIAPVAEALAPTPKRLEWARRVIDAYERALDEGAGVVALDGEMIDVPVARRAYAVLQQAETGGNP
ncbi:MAG: hpcH/HpaI aldolase/citrate lyase family protein [Conexibacter sp.]|nr:hpcH/HpaI aldolase/citrate lyase family protein [Conexibacter sp.]